MKNPKTKINDKILLIKGRNGNNLYEGQVGIVTKERQPGSNHIYVKFNNNTIKPVYYTGPADEFTMADKKQIIESYKEQKKELEEQIVKINQEIEFHTKYSSQEEFVADKLARILAKPDKKSIEKILRELKGSNML